MQGKEDMIRINILKVLNISKALNTFDFAVRPVICLCLLFGMPKDVNDFVFCKKNYVEYDLPSNDLYITLN